ncbi:ribosomal RNA processing protein [Irpex lacteus]|nr:ribosomal RNA processing protein [Irpex lacteus]
MAATAAASSSSQTTALPLAKSFASTDKKTRDKAIKSLAAFLSQPSDGDDANVARILPKSEMAKLWKGIFYCFWMSDKPLVQQALATEIAEMLLTIPTATASLAFLRGFWEATVREWAGIDRLRIDKYYMLIRRFTNASFRLLERESWDSALLEEYNSILSDRGGPLCPDDVKVPPSLPYHLADIYLEELDKALNASTSQESPTPAPLSTLLDPFISLAAGARAKLTVQRIESALLAPLFDAFDSALSPEASSSQSDDEDAEENQRSRKRARLDISPDFPHILAHSCLTPSTDAKTLTARELKKGLLKRLFEVASDTKTRDGNRRKMYAFWKARASEDDGEE